MTHRLYINEYNQELVYQLSHNAIDGYFCTDESTNNVLVISGEIEDLQKLSSLMYVEDEEKIKTILPGFITTNDVDKDIKAACDAVYDVFQKELLAVINKHYQKTNYCLTHDPTWCLLADTYDKMCEQRLNRANH